MKTKKEPSLNTFNSEIEEITPQNNHAELGQIEVQQFTGFKLLRNVFEETDMESDNISLLTDNNFEMKERNFVLKPLNIEHLLLAKIGQK